MLQTYEYGKWKNVIKSLELEDICLHYQNMPNIFTWFLKVENIFLLWLEKDITRETLERWCTSGLEDRKWTHSHKASKKRQEKGSSLLVNFFSLWKEHLSKQFMRKRLYFCLIVAFSQSLMDQYFDLKDITIQVAEMYWSISYYPQQPGSKVMGQGMPFQGTLPVTCFFNDTPPPSLTFPL